jgi:hypothetical protein
MDELARLLLLLGLAGVAVTLAGSAYIWFMDEARRLRRALKKVLGAAPDAAILALGRGTGAGFTFNTNLAAVAWDSGAWCLVYRIDELVGAEIIVDGTVVARAYRGEPRRPLEQAVDDAQQVTLRLIFDDAAHPDFELHLYVRGDEGKGVSAKASVQEANRWIARAEAILRRPGERPTREVEPSPPPHSPPPAAPLFDQADDETDGNAPPWDENDGEDDPDDLDAPPR